MRSKSRDDCFHQCSNRLCGRAIKIERDVAQIGFGRAVAELRPDARIPREKVAAFASVMRENICAGAIAFRRADIRAVVDPVEADDSEIRIHGRRNILERLVMGGGATPAETTRDASSPHALTRSASSSSWNAGDAWRREG